MKNNNTATKSFSEFKNQKELLIKITKDYANGFEEKNMLSFNLSPEQIKSEIDKCENVIYTVTGKHTSVLRPPHGFVSENFAKVTSTMGYDVVLWSIDTRDWSLTPSNTIYTTVMKNLKGGDIILMHDYVSGGNTTCDALRKIIPELLSQGYEFVTISELIAR